jgi:hypothetical protein
MAMLELAFVALLANRAFQICGHLHYFIDRPIRRNFQKTRAGHVIFTIHDGLSFAADALLVSANFIFISLALGHLLVACVQLFAWQRYCQSFFDVVAARSYYSDGLHRTKRIAGLTYDLIGQVFSMLLLLYLLRGPLAYEALSLGVLAYVLFTSEAVRRREAQNRS